MKRYLLSAFMILLLGLPLAAGPTTDPENYKPSPFSNDATAFLGAGMMEHLSFGLGLSFTYERNPIQLFDTATDRVTRTVVGDHLTADLLLSLGLFEWVDLGIALPAIMFQSGDGWNDKDGLPKGSLGDLRFAARARLFRTEDRFFSLAFVPVLTFPTGQALHDLSGSDGVTFSPTVVAELSSRWAGGGINLFYRLTQNDTTIGPVHIADQVGIRLQATAFAIPEMLSFTAEISAATTAGKTFGKKAESPVEALLSARWRYEPINLSLTAGGGAGIVKGFAAPEMRFFLGLSWTLPREEKSPSSEPETSPVAGPAAAGTPAPAEPPKTEATPPAETKEPAPTSTAVTPTPEQKPKVVEIGAPATEKREEPHPTPAQPVEKKTTPQPPQTPAPKPAEKQTTTPQPTTPAPSAPQSTPAAPAKQQPPATPPAPKQPSTPPAPAPKKPEPKTGTPMAEVIYFKENSTEITDDSRVKLEKINLLLSTNYTLKVRIEGHADRTEKPELGLKRAQAIKLWLVDRDIQSSRIQTKGIGADEPVASSDVEADRARNRRVVFYVLNE